MKISVKHEDFTTISPSGSISSANIQEFENAAANEPGNADGVIIDAAELEYISSAGLRVLLSLKKRCGKKPLRIINVNDEVMNIFDVTGFSEIMDITKSKRKISVDNCVKIGSGACGEVFRIDDETIIKLYYPRVSKEEIEREKMLSKKAFVMGVPTAISYDIVESDGRTGVIYELINSKTLGELMREDGENLEKHIDMYADVCRTVHSIEAKPGELPSFKEINRADIPNISGVTDEEREYLYRFLDLVPERENCIHGDLNINNIMVQNGECCLIDMGEFSTGIPMFDISRILFSMHFAADGETGYNGFYKMDQETVEYILSRTLKKYFGADTLAEAEEKNPDAKWLYPLAWFRCCTSLLKGTRWSDEKRSFAVSLLREKIIPFVNEHRND
jgi:uncharacterized protein (TIGR02172 family)